MCVYLSLHVPVPVQVPIHHAEEVEQVFDAISYCKGSTVVRMAACILGPDHFRAGLQLYMRRFQVSLSIRAVSVCLHLILFLSPPPPPSLSLSLSLSR